MLPGMVVARSTTARRRPKTPARRRARRGALRLAAELPVLYCSATLSFRGRSVDLSARGALVLSPLCDPVGTRAELVFETPSGDAVIAACQVVRVSRGEHPGMGVAFLSLSAPADALLPRLA